jgi:hypothetical protein
MDKDNDKALKKVDDALHDYHLACDNTEQAVEALADDILRHGENGEFSQDVIDILVRNEFLISELWRFIGAWSAQSDNGAARTAIAIEFAASVAEVVDDAAVDIARNILSWGSDE